MKKLSVVLLITSVFCCCKKENSVDPHEDPKSMVDNYLKHTLPAAQYNSLDWHTLTVSGNEESFIRIGFLDRSSDTAFIVMKFSGNQIEDGRIITFSSFPKEGGTNVVSRYSLKGSRLTKDSLVNGFVSRPKQRPAPQGVVASNLMMREDEPPVIIFQKSALPNIGTMYYVNLQSAYNDRAESSGNSHEYHRGMQKPTASSTGTNNHTAPEVISVDRENQQPLPGLDVIKYLQCFDKVPDNSSTIYRVILMVDIPVDRDPSAYFDFSTGFPGHTFLQLQKLNGASNVIRNIGFYPTEGWKTKINDGAVPSKFVDNSHHEYNASITTEVKPHEFNAVITYIRNAADNKYDLDDYNCTDMALQAFNKAVPYDPLKPGKTTHFNSLKAMNSPQTLYKELKRRKTASRPDNRISITGKKAYANPTRGFCN
jgi:hypothetical protein